MPCVLEWEVSVINYVIRLEAKSFRVAGNEFFWGGERSGTTFS